MPFWASKTSLSLVFFCPCDEVFTNSTEQKSFSAVDW